MAEITRERTGELVQKLFEILIKNSEGLQARDALEKLAASVKLTPYEAGEYESTGTRRFEKIVRFATVDCAKAGWLLKENGTWTITEAGVAAYSKYKQPGDLFREATRLYRVWKSGQPEKISDAKEAALEDQPEKKVAVTFEEAEDQARAEISEYISSLPPFEFQDLVAALIKGLGYHVSWNAPPGKDGGIDIIAHPDALGTKPPRIKVQVKRTAEKINSDGVRAFLALINEDDVGLYVSVGGFTKDAEDFARYQERRKITLINLNQFRKLWIDNYSRLDDKARKRFPLTPIYFLTPAS
jgi:restriction system protein